MLLLVPLLLLLLLLLLMLDRERASEGQGQRQRRGEKKLPRRLVMKVRRSQTFVLLGRARLVFSYLFLFLVRVPMSRDFVGSRGTLGRYGQGRQASRRGR
jgi:hypothetical protein